MTDWQPIATAPRDGKTKVSLTWMEDGSPAEVFHGFVWRDDVGNPIVQEGLGIWAAYAKNGVILATWSERHSSGAPTHWKPMKGGAE